MLSYRIGSANDFHWGLNQSSAEENYLLTHPLLEKKKLFTHFTKVTEQNNRNVNGTYIFQAMGRNRESYTKSLLSVKIITIPWQKGLF